MRLATRNAFRPSSPALSFTTSFVTKGNIFGSKPRDRIADWATEKDTEYDLRRSVPWDKGIEGPVVPRKAPDEGVKADSGARGDLEAASHADVRTESLIRESLWNEASWTGTGFADFGDRNQPPLLLLLFRQRPPAERIFVRWLEELGNEDIEERLRISIIRGIDSKDPHAYTVIVGSNWPQPEKHAGLSIMVSRLNTMSPNSGKNLDRFLALFESSGSYDLTFGSISAATSVPELGSQRIRKRALFVRDAWQIGENDPDCVGINPSLDPILPEGQSKAPILQLLEKLRKGGKRMGR